MPETQFDIASRALLRVGHPAITSFEDGTTGASIAAAEYEPLVVARLSEYRWRFATTQVALNRLADTPVGRWQYAWQAPADALAIHAVLSAGLPVRHDRYGDKIFADIDDGLIADYSFRATEDRWPAYFTQCIGQELAALFAASVARDPELAEMLGNGLERAWGRARLADSQQQTARRIAPSRLIGVRY
jgi:hypothetical protein